MLKTVFLLAIVAIALGSAKPVEYDDEYDYQSAALPSAPTQQTYYDGDSEERGARNVRHAQSDVAPTIQLGDLISAVEHTLVHSNQNLAIANATNATSLNSEESNTGIVLPINLSTSTTEATLLQGREIDEDVAETTPYVEGTTESDEAITTTSTVETSNNITIIQTIKSSQITPSETSDGVRVQLQHITLFSAGAGVFPNLPSVNLDALTSNSPVVADEPTSITDVSEGSSSNSSEENSDECSPKNSENDSAESTESKSVQKCAKTSVDSDVNSSESHVQKN